MLYGRIDYFMVVRDKSRSRLRMEEEGDSMRIYSHIRWRYHAMAQNNERKCVSDESILFHCLATLHLHHFIESVIEGTVQNDNYGRMTSSSTSDWLCSHFPSCTMCTERDCLRRKKVTMSLVYICRLSETMNSVFAKCAPVLFLHSDWCTHNSQYRIHISLRHARTPGSYLHG